MSLESQPRRAEHSRMRKALAAGAAALAMSGCASAANQRPYQVTPNMQGYLWRDKNGNVDDTRCFSGGDRPCAILLRTEPKREAPVINAKKITKIVKWPRESYAGKKGDSLTVLCYEPDGEEITSYEGNLVSKDWYQVQVTAEQVVNPDAHPSPIDGNSQKGYIGWASVTWFNQTAHNAAVPRC